MTNKQDRTLASPDNMLPEAEMISSRRWLPSLIWLVPIIAGLIGIALVVQAVTNHGPTITISFSSAEGIEPGKTKVKFKAVEIGSVRAIRLAPGLSNVLVDVELTKDAEDFASKDSRFWIVRPQIGSSGVTGLGTLLSGAYIGADAGRSEQEARDFVGLETPPAVTIDAKGLRFSLHAESLGSLNIGSPIFYRRVQVGQITSYSLDENGTGVTLQAFVHAPYDDYIGSNTRWWHASGVNVKLDSNGFKLNTQSLATVVLGGVAFQNPSNQDLGAQVTDNTIFKLANDETEAMRDPDGMPTQIVMYFNQSIRGLSVGAPIDFRGITLGNVTSIGIQYDPASRNFIMPVTMDIYTHRLSRQAQGLRPAPAQALKGEALLKRMIEGGLSGQLRTGNLLTGQLYIALDRFPKSASNRMQTNSDILEIPTVPNTLDELQVQIAEIVEKLNQVPFGQIGENLDSTLKQASMLMQQMNETVVPQMRDTLTSAQKTFSSAEATLQQDSPLQSDVRQALQELTRTLQSLNALSEYLERHPEALLRGKPGDEK